MRKALLRRAWACWHCCHSRSARCWCGSCEPTHPHVAAALSAYAAVVVAFLGGVHWGFGFTQAAPAPRLFVWGVVPALVAWVAVLMPPYAGLVIHGAMLAACYAVDRKVYPAHGAAAWLTLRFRLSVGASLSCFIGAAGS